MTAAREVVGVLGGTFDPIHEGHLAMAERALRALGLARVLMVLTGTPPHKQVVTLTPIAHRTAMLQLAAADRHGLEPSGLESADGVSYTIDTLVGIRNGTPPRDPVFVMGSDSLLDLPNWREAERLVETFDLCVIYRTGADPRNLADRVAPFVRERLVALELNGEVAANLGGLQPGRGGRVFLLPAEPVDVSSSNVRAVVTRGEDPAGLVPVSVAEYIQDNDLYRQDSSKHSTEDALTNSIPPVPQGTADDVSTAPIPPAIAHCVAAALDKKAEDLIVLDLHGISDVTDYFVICHGGSNRQVIAIADGIEERLKRELRERPANVEGRTGGDWILLDYIDFVVHVFVADRREFYRLESLWGDARRLDLDGLDTAPTVAG